MRPASSFYRFYNVLHFYFILCASGGQGNHASFIVCPKSLERIQRYLRRFLHGMNMVRFIFAWSWFFFKEEYFRLRLLVVH